jgi:RHS repeat-associated protein
MKRRTNRQVYGMGGELLAEYAANTSYGTPQKEYGYRNGQLLITAEAPAATGATSAMFVQTDTTTQGNWKGMYGSDGYNVINDAVSYPAYAQVSVSGQSSYTWAASTGETRAPLKAASTTERLASCWYSGTNVTIDVNLTDGHSHKIALYTIYWDGSDARQGRIEVLDAGTNAVLDTRDVNVYTSGKYLVWTLRGHVKMKFTHISPAAWNQVISGLFFDPASGGGSSAPQINWLVADQLGTPRMVFDKTGTLGNVKRHDYLPFGEELVAGQGGRTSGVNGLGYAGDPIRQKFTSKERDIETGLDYFGARYYSSVQGRFTGVDIAGPNLSNPQSLNKYTYTLNNPLRYIDQNGLYEEDVHRDLTRTLAYAAGFSESEATSIANANQGIDDHPDTEPIAAGTGHPGDPSYFYYASAIKARKDWHFTTEERRDFLWSVFQGSSYSVTLFKDGEKRLADSLDSLGRYLHPQQDSFSHAGFGAFIGHGLHGSAPDRTYRRPGLADDMARDTYSRLLQGASLLQRSATPIPYSGFIERRVAAFNRATTLIGKNNELRKIMFFVTFTRRRLEQPIEVRETPMTSSVVVR